MQDKQNQALNQQWAQAGLLEELLGEAQLSYAESPTGRLSIEQILNGEQRVIWEENNPVKSLGQKKIVITDWSYAQGLPSYDQCFAIYQRLLNEGFLLYVWANDDLVAVKNSAELRQALNAVNPVNEILLQEEMKKKDLSHDALYLADKEGTHCLIKALKDSNFKEVLYLSDLKRLSQEHADDLLSKLPKLSAIELTLDKDTLNDIELLKSWFQHMSSIHLKNFPEEMVRQIIQLCPHLKKLELSQCNSLGDCKDISLPTSFESLVCSETNITWRDVQYLGQHCPNLKTLNLSLCKNLGDCKDICLPASLESFVCSETNITWRDVQYLGQHCPNLKTLDLNSCENLGDCKDISLPASLESLDCSHTNITWRDVNYLSQNCPNLKTLVLICCENLGDCKDICLPASLESLDCTYTNITWRDVHYLSQNRTNLKTLNLRVCKNLGDCKDISLPTALESLVCLGTNISWSDVHHLSQNCPKLKILNLRFCKNLGECKDICLPASLESLDCSRTNITWRDVHYLSQHCPHLKELTLDNCQNLGDCKDIILPVSLESLDYTGANITWSDVQHLSQNCPNLKKLDLRNCKRLGDCKEISLPASLESLVCSVTNITWSDVQHIIDKCPYLKEINLDYCYNLGDYPQHFIIPEGLRIIRSPKNNTSDATNKPHTNQAERILDNQTEHTKSHNVRTLFKPKKNNPLDPTDYRLSIYTELDAKTKTLKKSPKTFQDNNTYPSAANVENRYDEILENSANCFLGRMRLDSQDWMAMPSLTVEDTIDAADIQLEPSTDFSLVYCQEEALYYIKPKNLTSNTTLTFILKTEAPAKALPETVLCKEQRQSLKKLQFDQNGNLPLHQAEFQWLTKENACQALIAFCQTFKAKKLPNPNAENLELLNQLIAKTAGHCRHRAQVFKALAEVFAIDCRYVENDCHAYVEILQDKQWIKIDLGGSAAKLHLKPFLEELNELDPQNPFQTWNTHPSHSNTLSDYADELLQIGNHLPEGKRNLLCTLAREQLDGLHQALLEQTKQHKQKLFYIDDLNYVPQQQIITDNDTGQYGKQDSPLMEFFKNAGEGDVLMVNWSDYEAQHVGFNTLMDKERSLKQVLLNKGVTVLNVLSHDQAADMGEDFYSRSRDVSQMPAYLTANPIAIPQCPINTEAEEICFYDEDWRSTFTGALQLTAKGYALTESSLIKALKEARQTLVLRNAPWHLASFRAFIRTIESSQEIQANGETYSLNGAKLYRNDTPYELKDAPVTFIETLPAEEEVLILNNTTYHTFFHQYHEEKGILSPVPGHLALHQNKTINVLLTNPLSNGHWEKLRLEAIKQGVHLNVALAPGAIKHGLSDKKVTPISISSPNVVLSNDLDYTIREEHEKVIIHISEKTKLSDLLETITCGESGQGSFAYQPSALAKALLAEKQVVLVGNPSRQLAEGLASLCLPKPYLVLNGHCIPCKGTVTLVSEEAHGLGFIQGLREEISSDDLWQALSKKHGQEHLAILKAVCDDFIKTANLPAFSYQQLDSMASRMQWKPQANPIKHLLRLHPQYKTLKPLMDKAWESFKTTREPRARLDKIRSEFQHSPYVFIAGESGIGKSHFVQQELAQHFDIVEGLENLDRFLTAGDKEKCLFIDEANLLHPNALAMFKGLLLNPPQLLVNGQLVPVPKGHKIVFAGNFGHFKSRQDIPFFAQQGHILTFKELSEAQFREDVLAPILKALHAEHECSVMAEVFIKLFKHYKTNLSLTARNLEMMALRSKAYSNTMTDMTQIACMSAYDEIGTLLSSQEKIEFYRFCEAQFNLDKRFLKEKKQELKANTVLVTEDFFLTKSRKNSIRLLENLINIREEKMTNAYLQKKGINAMLIEGDPGIGKSLLVMAYLCSKGFANGLDHPEFDNKYYYLTPAMGLDLIKETLHKAFHEGAVVIIDELNTLPLESVLNPLLSGVDASGRKADKPGFTLFATQNPTSFAKRQTLSPAFLNRFQKINLKNYPAKELKEIMTDLSANPELAQTKVNQYTQALRFANAKHLHPKPTTRHLFSM